MNIRKIRKIIKWTWFPVLVLIALLWYRTPVTFLKGVEPDQVARLTIFDGNTGEELTVTDQGQIATVVENIRSVKVRRGGIAFLNMGYRFRMTFLSADGQQLAKFTVNSKSLIRDTLFFYETEEDELCFDYIHGLLDAAFDYSWY